MKCYFCPDTDARGVCTKCGRGVCKDHSEVTTQMGGLSVKSYNLVCKECISQIEEKGI
ncbi:MAG TPA: DUF2180 family protein [Nitrososphaerales archaeon]|nr:DUF2180 family protein [Nitrososphaerales archaeon]